MNDDDIIIGKNVIVGNNVINHLALGEYIGDRCTHGGNDSNIPQYLKNL